MITDLPEKDRERWQSFVTSALADMNKKNTSELVSLHLSMLFAVNRIFKYFSLKSFSVYTLQLQANH